MIFKKKYLLLILFLIIIQTLIYASNKQKTSFRYFKWTIPEVSIGKLIGISFFSGLFISTLLNNTFATYKKNSFEDIEENYNSSDNEKDVKTNFDMPPQRDIRDTQPTISVNYRVVKNIDNNLKKEQNYSNRPDNDDGWDNKDFEW